VLDLLLGLHAPDSGRILIDGRPLGIGDLPGWRAAVGYVPQDTLLLDATISDNIVFGAGEDAGQVTAAAALAHADAFIRDRGPSGYATPVGERGVRLSGGQRQRLALARALFSRPSLLALDEATGALDSAVEDRIAAQLLSLGRELTVVMVTHRLRSVRDFDLVYYLRGGRVLASGAPATVIAAMSETERLLD